METSASNMATGNLEKLTDLQDPDSSHPDDDQLPSVRAFYGHPQHLTISHRTIRCPSPRGTLMMQLDISDG